MKRAVRWPPRVVAGWFDALGRQIGQLWLKSGPRGEGMKLWLRADVFRSLLRGDAVARESAEPLAEAAVAEWAATRAVAIAGLQGIAGVRRITWLTALVAIAA